MISYLYKVKRMTIVSEIEMCLPLEIAIGVQKYLTGILKAGKTSFVFLQVSPNNLKPVEVL